VSEGKLSTTPKGRPEAPHVPAAFINAIAEEGTKAEAVEWLQKTWNELCRAESEIRKVREDLERAVSNHAADLSLARSEIERSLWVPVSERLPEGDADVLTIDRDGKVHGKPAHSVRTDSTFAMRAGNKPFYTHWMPLPAAPEPKP